MITREVCEPAAERSATMYIFTSRLFTDLIAGEYMEFILFWPTVKASEGGTLQR